MEGISTEIYRGKKIFLVDFTNFGKTESETLKLISAVEDEFIKNPLESVLALINVEGAFFHFKTFKAFKDLDEKTEPYAKRVAIIGLTGLKKTGFNTITSSNKKGTTRAFDSELEAKEWLISD